MSAKSKTPAVNSKQAKGRATILFGLDEKEQPRGAFFRDADESTMTRMAKTMGLRIALPHAPYQLAVATKLPQGDLQATGLKAVPVIALEFYEKLNALVGGETGVISSSMPSSWKEIEPSSLVLAHESLSDGWFEAVVRRRQGEKLVLLWRDHPGLGEFTRDANSVALIRNQ